MEGDVGRRGLKQQQPSPPWTTVAQGHGFSLAVAAGCFPWPPSPPSSSYACGYCRREFRSAQALGGHMNVHRRDRARLRQCYYPSSSSSSSSLPTPAAAAHRRTAAPAHPLPSRLHFSPASPPRCAAAAEPVVYSFFSAATTASAVKAAVEVDLELGIGVCGGGGGAEEGGVDLELRLGCAWE
ncbi:hypothetical protein ACP4OV_029033 [Aristida adscensionis]